MGGPPAESIDGVAPRGEENRGAPEKAGSQAETEGRGRGRTLTQELKRET